MSFSSQRMSAKQNHVTYMYVCRLSKLNLLAILHVITDNEKLRTIVKSILRRKIEDVAFSINCPLGVVDVIVDFCLEWYHHKPRTQTSQLFFNTAMKRGCGFKLVAC